MKRLLFPIFSIFIFSHLIFSQTPTPTPVTDDDVVKISTTLIQVDVTVTDKKGNPVKDLKAEDFEIYENGKRQKITNLSFISSQTATETDLPKKTENSKIEIPPPTKQIKPNEVRRTVALIVDDLSLSFESTHYVRQALRFFVDKQMQEGDLVAIIRTGSGIGALQQFTSDKRRLYAAIDKIKWNLRGSGGMGVFDAFSSHKAFDPEVEKGASPGNEDVPISEAGVADSRKELFTAGSLGAIRYVVEGMDRLPGRKSAILFSDGFQVFARGDSKFTGSSRILDSLTRLVESANRAAVVIYTMDARGLQPVNFTAADDFGSDFESGGVARVDRASRNAINDRLNAFKNSQDGINYLAKETGGFSIYNTNDLKGGIKKVMNDQSYYLIAYEPDSETFDPEKQRFNKLDVKVLRDDIEVRYRSGFFGISDDKMQKPAANLTGNDKLLNALTSPFAINDINMSLSTVFKGDEKDNLFINSYLHISAGNLKFTDAEKGAKKATFDVFVANFGDNGVPTGEISKTFTIEAKGQTLETIMRDGFVYYFTFPIKKPGAYQMRAAIRDKGTDKVGSASQFIEVPKLKKDHLILSGIVVDNISYKDWNAGLSADQSKLPAAEKEAEKDLTAMLDTALRQFKRGSVLQYALEIYNAETDAQNNTQLQMRTRLFRDNKLIYEGKDIPVNSGQNINSAIKAVSGAINLGTDMSLGDYVLQIIVTDKLAKKKRQIATQFVQFEIVE